MPVYHVSYDLHVPGQNYPRIEEAIRASAGWYHLMQSTWLIFTSESCNVLNRRLLEAVDTNDTLFVSEVKEGAGWISNDARDWLDKHL